MKPDELHKCGVVWCVCVVYVWCMCGVCVCGISTLLHTKGTT